MNAAHTPFPWTKHTLPDGTLEILGRDSLPVAVTSFYRNGSQQANARLMIAIPYLVAALEECVLSLVNHHMDGHVYSCDAKRIDDARAALAIAKGGAA
jgi:hypothetical protein